MKRCYFCGSYAYSKIKVVGKENGKRRQKTCDICNCCSAMGDNRWMEEKLCWDYDSLKIKE